MRCTLYLTALFTITLLGASPAAAQEIVHSLSGTVQQINPQNKTIQINTNDGSEGTFAFRSPTSPVHINFDRDVQDRTTPVASFTKTGATVVLYYYGNDAVRTAVAVQDLGPGPLDTVEGTITKYNKKAHTLTVRDTAGKDHTFTIDPKAMADSPEGAVAADRLDLSKGDNVRVIATKAKGPETALFIRD